MWYVAICDHAGNTPTISLLFIGASLSEPHTSVTALQDACVCLSAYVRTCGHIPKILIERTDTVTRTFQI